MARSAASARLGPGAAVQPQRAVHDDVPTRNTGLNADTGLWKIIAIRAPADLAAGSRWDSPVSSSPSSWMLPLTVAPTVCERPSTASVVIDLPEPLSPASPTISPASTSSSASSTTGRVPNAICRSRIGSFIAGTSAPRVEQVAQAVTEQVEGERGQQDRDPGEGHEPPLGREVGLALRHHQPPLGRRVLGAEAEERQRRGGQDHPADVERDLDDERRDRVRQDVAEHDPVRGDAQRPAALDVGAPGDRGRLAAEEPGVPGPPGDRDREGQRGRRSAGAPPPGPGRAAAPGRPGRCR